MLKLVIAGLTAFALLTAPAYAASTTQCRDAAGKFIKCPAKAKPAKCRDAKGKFKKCGA